MLKDELQIAIFSMLHILNTNFSLSNNYRSGARFTSMCESMLIFRLNRKDKISFYLPTISNAFCENYLKFSFQL